MRCRVWCGLTRRRRLAVSYYRIDESLTRGGQPGVASCASFFFSLARDGVVPLLRWLQYFDGLDDRLFDDHRSPRRGRDAALLVGARARWATRCLMAS